MGLALPKWLNSGLWQGQGATGRSVIVVLQKNNFLKKTGVINRIGPQKVSFRGCSGSRSCAEQMQTCIGGDAWASGGPIARTERPWYLPTCCAKHFTFRKKCKNGPNIASFNGHAHVICWIYEKSNCTCGFLVKFWYKNILRLSPNSK